MNNMLSPAYESFVNDIAMEFLGLSKKEKDESFEVNKAKEYLENKSNYNSLCEKFRKHAVVFIGDVIYSDSAPRNMPIPKASDFEITDCDHKICGKVKVNQMRLKYVQSDGGFVQICCSMKVSESFKNKVASKYHTTVDDLFDSTSCISSYDITHDRFVDMYDLYT